MQRLSSRQLRGNGSQGQGLLEYAITLSLIAMVVIGLLGKIGKATDAALCQVSNGLAKGGPVYIWGDNNHGEYGNGTSNSTTNNVPTAVPNFCGADVVAGYNSILALKTDETVWAWGDNEAGQTGQPTAADTLVPTQVAGLPKGIIALSSGLESSMALTADGTVYAWELNNYGQLGKGTIDNSINRTPVVVTFPGNDKIKAITSGQYDNTALGATGKVYTWGFNGNGNVGDGSWGEANPAGCNCEATPIAAIGTFTNVAAIYAAHSAATYAVKTDGTLYAWGAGNEGEIGNQAGSGASADAPTPVGGGTCGSPLTGITQVSPTLYGAYALDSSGNVWAWGQNAYHLYNAWTISQGGESGNNTSASNTWCPVQVHGAGNTGTLNAGVIGSGCFQGLAVSNNNTTLAWGSNFVGESGNTATNPQLYPVSVGSFPATPIKINGGLSFSMAILGAGS